MADDQDLGEMTESFIREMLRLGVLRYEERDTLWTITKHCAKLGVPTAGAFALMGIEAGSVMVPGFGTISGAAAGALVGFAYGTGTCIGITYGLREELKGFASETNSR